MLPNLIKIAIRNLKKFKLYSFINIAGLTIGLTCFILISLYLLDEMNYDRFHENGDRIFRIALITPNGGTTRTPHPMSQALVNDFPEVEQGVSISPIWGDGLTWLEVPIQYKDKRFQENRLFSADTSFFDVFTFNSVYGDTRAAIREPGALILTYSSAKKYFGDENPVGKFMRLDDRHDMIVKAVIEDIPLNSHFKFDFLTSYLTLKPMETSNYYTWADFGHFNYIVLKNAEDWKSVEARIPEWSKKYIDYSIPDLQSDYDLSKFLKLQLLTDIHLKSHLRWELEQNGDITHIYIFSVSAILILLIACINFMNLATARSFRRAKEVGVRKVVGAGKTQLMLQFLVESLLLTSLAMFGAGVLIEFLLPYFNSFTGKEISISIINDWEYIAGLFALTFITGLLAGSYPAFFLSSFKPIQILRGRFNTNPSSSVLRKGLVVFQFSISIFLIASTIVIYQQVDYLKTHELGFAKEHVLIVPMRDSKLQENYRVFKNSLMANSEIISAAGVTNIPGGQFNVDPIRWKPEQEAVGVSEIWVDEDFFNTLEIQLSAGRGFSREFRRDSSRAFILNESAAKRFDWQDPVGEEIYYYPQDRTVKGEIIGVVKDFNFQSLHQNISPLLLHYLDGWSNNLLVRIKGNDIQGTIKFIENSFNKLSPGNEFEYSFLDEYFDKAYRGEEGMEKLFIIFAVLAIIIACLGLFGLASFTAEQKTKEIGVRKVMGASITSLVILLCNDFSKLVLAANLLAWPIIYYLMNNWLNEFAYKIDISLVVLVFSGIIAFIIALLTIAYQSIKAAMSNPIESLKYE